MLAVLAGWLVGRGPGTTGDRALPKLLGRLKDPLKPLQRVGVRARGGAMHQRRKIDEDRRGGEGVGLGLFEQSLLMLWIAAHVCSDLGTVLFLVQRECKPSREVCQGL